jgi:hypothetical protein
VCVEGSDARCVTFLEGCQIAVEYPEAGTGLERGEERNMRRFTLLALAASVGVVALALAGTAAGSARLH